MFDEEDNADTVPLAAIEAQNARIASDFAKWVADNEAPFFTSDTIAENPDMAQVDDAARAIAGGAGVPAYDRGNRHSF